ncbi:MAG: hypothetical protein WBX15_07755 [Thermoanaerobaculia bacterium]
MHVRNRFPLLILGLSLLSLVGCNGSGKPSPATTSHSATATAESAPPEKQLDACKLLPSSAIAEVLGEPAGEPRELVNSPMGRVTPGMSSCLFKSSTSDRELTLFVEQSPIENPHHADAVREELADSSVKMITVPGLGNDAFWQFDKLHVFEGGKYYLIVTPKNFPAPDAGHAAAVDLARRALAAIGKE